MLAYGNTRQLVLGLEVVLADGRIWNGLNALKKDNTGYDLKDLFIGSEGTLGIITAAVLKLFPKPAEKATAILALPELANAIESDRPRAGDRRPGPHRLRVPPAHRAGDGAAQCPQHARSVLGSTSLVRADGDFRRQARRHRRPAAD